jgi:hypothetical protein
LPQVPVSYVDDAAWLDELERKGALEPSRSYWRDELDGLHRDPLAADPEIVERGSTRVAVCRLGIRKELVQRVEANARLVGTSLTNALLAALFDVVHARSDHDDMAIDLSLSARDRPELRRLVGRVSRHLVVRVDAGKAPTYRDLLRATHDKVFLAMTHQRWSPEKTAADLGLCQRPQRSFFTNVFFLKVDVAGQLSTSRPDPFSIQYEELPTDAPLEMLLLALVYDDGIDLVFRNRAALWDRSFMVRLLEDYAVALARIADDVDARRPAKLGGAPGAFAAGTEAGT